MSINHFITLAKAIEMTELCRAEKENMLIPALRNTSIVPICETFDRNAFDSLLAQTGCVGLRAYFGMDANLKVRVIVVGVNDQNEDMLPSETVDGGNIVEEGQICPDLCPPLSPLNG